MVIFKGLSGFFGAGVAFFKKTCYNLELIVAVSSELPDIPDCIAQKRNSRSGYCIRSKTGSEKNEMDFIASHKREVQWLKSF